MHIFAYFLLKLLSALFTFRLCRCLLSSHLLFCLCCPLKKKKDLFTWERKRESVCVGTRAGERQRESPAHSLLSAERNLGSISDLWDHDLSGNQVRHLTDSATQAPHGDSCSNLGDQWQRLWAPESQVPLISLLLHWPPFSFSAPAFSSLLSYWH